MLNNDIQEVVAYMNRQFDVSIDNHIIIVMITSFIDGYCLKYNLIESAINNDNNKMYMLIDKLLK